MNEKKTVDFYRARSTTSKTVIRPATPSSVTQANKAMCSATPNSATPSSVVTQANKAMCPASPSSVTSVTGMKCPPFLQGRPASSGVTSEIMIDGDSVDDTFCGRYGSRKQRRCQSAKLMVLSILPGIVLIVSTAVYAMENVQSFYDNREVQATVKLSLEIGSVIHAIQLERGTSTLYVSSNGDVSVKRRLQRLYQKTEDAINALCIWIAVADPSYFQTRDLFHQHMEQFRATLDKDHSNTSFHDVIKFYSEYNSVLLLMVTERLSLRKKLPFWTDITAYQMLMLSKEQAGIERALGSTYFAVGYLSPEDHLWYSKKNVLGTTFLQQCMSYSGHARMLMETLYFGSDIYRELERQRRIILDATLVSPSTRSSTVWFDNMTDYIDTLNIVQDKLADVIVKAASNANHDIESTLFVSGIQFTLVLIMVPVIVILVRNVISQMHTFSVELRDKTLELEDERKRTEELLFQLLPRTVARRLMEDGSTVPESYHSATILFTDLVGFCLMLNTTTPMHVMGVLNRICLAIDTRLEKFDVYKVDTQGDGYMVISGIPNRNGDRHVEEIAHLALDLRDTVEELQVPDINNDKMKLRFGFNTGPCVAGVVGVKTPKYCIFGDTVNIASKMESTSEPSKIQMAEGAASKLKKCKGFKIRKRGAIEVKPQDVVRTFWLDSYELPSPQSIVSVEVISDVN